ncbi:TPA: DUF2635 domain-containing protein [Klebsiella michiganensis]|uniref:DUF2635 domain-containing protein n=2 Tax=Klebsiella TaxID=570 RepID=A0ABU9PCC6_9ENTR|nr:MULTISPECIES: DUF2635 domain-containing protein [Klebsiella]MDU6356931.1 DUF2635 domain-containing protein [Klebsiella grimontii]DAQ51539.1 MAG TPA: Protein of unknown function (DUF2635) [Caudoviricetes sp.]EKP1130406.1 DUF2635 domain-containing protein [Klebsiella michiganensis]EMB3264452.1 DUF2635 domain-containing protein [Klebsiella michiganensis]MBF8420965.1 DUF2635 domain-containing protein [Klebsiella pneumoniae]
MFVKPKDGLSVRCPVRGEALPKEGAEVPDNTFWRRRMKDGDVNLVQKGVKNTAQKEDDSK